MNTNEKLQVTLDAGVKRITFNNPTRRNAVDFGMFEAFAAAVEESATDESRVLVITGVGDFFCAGLDVKSVGPSELASMDVAARIRELINPPVMRLRTLPKPVVARVHGPAAGIGFSYVLASDVVIASEEATFSQSFVRVGLMPDGGATHLLPALVGRLKAFELMVRGEAISAQEALRLGLVNGVVPRAQLDALVDDLAAMLSVAPQPSLTHIKAALNLSERQALAASLDFEAEGQAECFASADFLEGVTAFMQKRAPQFGKGKA
ncbi:MAG TPA: enoyl-CoA hydratase [Pyrinomonadaceae bacterium]|jgi:2-(1,2-epoxy-1,2-dihydrophenyl)acetyl-CoA isomerase